MDYARVKTAFRKGGLLEEAEITVLVGSAIGLLHELEEFAQVVALHLLHGIEPDSDSGRRATASDDSTQREAFHPDFSVGNPQADFDAGP